MNFKLLNNEDIIKEFGKKYEKLRLQKNLSDEDIQKKGGVSKDAIHRLKNGSNINLINFIKILRGLGELDSLENILNFEESFSIKEKIKRKQKKRVFKKKESIISNKDFIWGDESEK